MKKNILLIFSLITLFLINVPSSFAVQELEDNQTIDYAISFGDIIKVQTLLNSPNAAAILNKYNKQGITPLQKASQLGKVGIVSKLLDYEDTKINKKSKGGNTTLHHLIGQMEIIQKSTYLELHHQQIKNYLAIAKMLIDHPRIDLTKQDKNSKTALELVEKQASHLNENAAFYQEIKQMILDRHRAANNSPNNPNSTRSNVHTNVNQYQKSKSNSNYTNHQMRKENKKNSFFAKLFNSIISPFHFAGQKIGTLQNYNPLKSLIKSLCFLRQLSRRLLIF